jgi:endonuclease YncB( thermonuclease family)
MVDTAQRAFLPEGVTLSQLQPLTNEEYSSLVAVKDAAEFSLNYKSFLAKVSKVTDGDTLKAVIFLHATPTRFVFRINGVDTPECRKGEAR